MVLISIFLAGPEPGLGERGEGGAQIPTSITCTSRLRGVGQCGRSLQKPRPATLPGTRVPQAGRGDRSRVWAPRPPFYWPKPQPSEQTARAQMCVCSGEAGGVRAGDCGGERAVAVGGERGRMP